jgi:hypothetical protein
LVAPGLLDGDVDGDDEGDGDGDADGEADGEGVGAAIALAPTTALIVKVTPLPSDAMFAIRTLEK